MERGLSSFREENCTPQCHSVLSPLIIFFQNISYLVLLLCQSLLTGIKTQEAPQKNSCNFFFNEYVFFLHSFFLSI